MAAFEAHWFERPLKGEDGVFHGTSGAWSVIAVVDGHGGVGAARLCCEQGLACLKRALDAGTSLADAMQAAFAELDARVKAVPGDTSGACVTVVAFDRLTADYVCANVGDTQALHVTPSSHWWITTSHRLQHNARERTRLGERVSRLASSSGPVGPPRLYPGGLSCSRVVGDADAPHASSTPDVSYGRLEAGDALVLASDGLWDHLSEARVHRLCVDTASAEAIARAVRTPTDRRARARASISSSRERGATRASAAAATTSRRRRPPPRASGSRSEGGPRGGAGPSRVGARRAWR